MSLSLSFAFSGPLYILIYVDDNLVLGPSATHIQNLITALASHFKLKDFGLASKFLGIEFHKYQDGYLLTQVNYTTALLQSLNMEHCKPLLNLSPTSCPNSSLKVTPDPFVYRRAVRALQFAINQAC